MHEMRFRSVESCTTYKDSIVYKYHNIYMIKLVIGETFTLNSFVAIAGIQAWGHRQ